jgi:uncharacterized protein YlaI
MSAYHYTGLDKYKLAHFPEYVSSIVILWPHFIYFSLFQGEQMIYCIICIIKSTVHTVKVREHRYGNPAFALFMCTQCEKGKRRGSSTRIPSSRAGSGRSLAKKIRFSRIFSNFSRDLCSPPVRWHVILHGVCVPCILSVRFV